MNYKRLEIYVGWTCNQKCTYCIEASNMDEAWDKKVTKYDILKKLIKYKQLGYNHVTYLGGEPFIQGVFLDALILGKKLGYTILVTTNCTTLHIDKQAKKFLPYIDQLFLSVEAIGIEEQQKISRTKNYVHWDGVFENINKYWKGNFLKANIVITQDNKNNLLNLVEFLYNKGVKDIAITYPDISDSYHGKEFLLEKVVPTYTECAYSIGEIITFIQGKNINLKIADIPFCIFPRSDIEKYIKLTDDYDYQTRVKVDYTEQEINRGDLKDFKKLPRNRRKIDICNKCIHSSICWGPSNKYKLLYGFDEINPITK